MLITSEHELREVISQALQAGAVGLDTEFVRERTFYPYLGLVQLAVKRECYLIDPLAINNLSPLGELIAAPEVIKILHDPQQDLAILKTAAGVNPRNIFDTRMAYGFSNGCATLSLAALLKNTLNIHLPKTETRANWLMRPLTGKMVDYACDDVRYLSELMEHIGNRAKAQNTEKWLWEEMKIFDSPAFYSDPDPRDYFRKIRGGEQLTGQQPAVLRELAAWREKTARRKNRPRGHVVKNNVLLILAVQCPQTTDALKKLKLLSPQCIKRYGDSLLTCISHGLSISPDERPVPRPQLSTRDSDRIYK
ncbi:MAG: HRDC domain-containing protein, partial [Victivallales bacterium]|nr:HRDC domain-containing protein [Victivallales bacterium]